MAAQILGIIDDPPADTMQIITSALALYQSAGFMLTDGAGLDPILAAEIWWRQFREAYESARRAVDS